MLVGAWVGSTYKLHSLFFSYLVSRRCNMELYIFKHDVVVCICYGTIAMHNVVVCCWQSVILMCCMLEVFALLERSWWN